jgi:hypothetical protein
MIPNRSVDNNFGVATVTSAMRTSWEVWSAKRNNERSRSVRWFYSDFVIDGTLNPLFATEISFGGLNRNVTEQKLDLLQFAARGVAKPCTGSPLMPHAA